MLKVKKIRLLGAICALLFFMTLVFVNRRPRLVDKSWMKKFNPSASGHFQVCRLSNRHYCSDRFIPILFPNMQNNSMIQGPRGIIEMTASFGPGQYEDPRILQINDKLAVLVFVRHTNIGSMCVALIDSDYKILGSIEYKCSKQTQKNWMPRLVGSSLHLYARVPDIIYAVPRIAGLKNHEVIEVSPMSSSEWRGSSQIIYLKNRGHYGILHKRLRPEISTFFLPGYKFAFYNFDNSKRLREFSIKDNGFVYINSIEQHLNGLRILCGVSDCVSVHYDLKEDQLDRLLIDGPEIVFAAVKHALTEEVPLPRGAS